MASKDQLNRRAFVVGLAASPLGFRAIERVLPIPPANKWVGNPVKALGSDILQTDANEIVRRFSEARLGTLCTYYQLFWPLQPGGYTLEGLQRETRKFLDEVSIQNPDFKEHHRIHVLPHLAGLHGLRSLTAEEASEVEHGTVGALQAWSDPARSYKEFGFRRREATEIFWQNATAAVIRNQDQWQSIRLPLVAKEAARQCTEFLRLDFPELLLPAVGALQFLLTYEKSLQNQDTPAELRAVRHLLGEIEEQTRRRNCMWFSQLFVIFRMRAARHEIPSQINEVFIGDDSLDGEFFRYANLVRFGSAYATQRVSEGTNDSPYIPRHPDAGKRGIAIFQNLRRGSDFAESITQGLELVDDPKNGLTREALAMVTEQLLSRQSGGAAEHEGAESTVLAHFQELRPLRRFDSLEQLRQYQSSRGQGYSEEALALAVGGVQLDVGLLRSSWIGQAEQQITQLENVKHLRQFISSSKNRIEDVVDKHLESTLPRLREWWQFFVQPMFRTTVAVPAGAPVERSQERSTEGAKGVVKKRSKDEVLAELLENEAGRRAFFNGVLDREMRLLQNDTRTYEEICADVEKNYRARLKRNNIVEVDD